MKTLKTVITLIALSIVAISCQREDISVAAPADNAATIIATISNDATRATFTDNAGSVALIWEANDEIMLYDADGNYAATFATSTGGGATATFTLSGGSVADGTYTAVYPVYYIEGVPAPTLAHRTQVVNGLTQDGNNNTAHLDAQSYMSGTLAYSTTGFTTNEVSFDMEFALLTVEVGTPTGYDYTTHGVPTSLTLYNGGKTTALFLENITTTDMTNGLTLYMVVDPYKNPTATPGEARALHFELITGNGTFVKEKANVSKEHEAGKRYTAALIGIDALELTTGVYTLATLPGDPSSAPTTWVVTDAITDITNLSALRTKIIERGKNIRLILPNATSIRDLEFIECTALSSISLPKATNIGASAFSRCTALSSISLPKATNIGNYAFRGCNRITSISLPKATSIGNYAFIECTALSSISLPAIASIGNSVFNGCTALSSISLPKATSIGNYAFIDCTALNSISLPMATSIGNLAFSNCTGLTSVSLPAAATIEDNAFYGCTTLSSISLPMATSIGGNAFAACTTLSSVSLPEAISIGAAAFGECAVLSSISLPEATTIGNSAFSNCTTLSSVSLPKVTDIGTYVFSNCTTLISISLPKATDIGQHAFSGCTALNSISLPEATSIGTAAFGGCAVLSSISLPKATNIGNYAFNNCSALNPISLPKATNIGQYAFSVCTALNSVSLPEVTSIGSYAFSNCSALNLLDLGGVYEMTFVGGVLFASGTTNIAGNVHLTVGAGEASNVNRDNKTWRGYGPFASVTIRR